MSRARALALALLLARLAISSVPARAAPEDALVGLYDGHQMEMGAQLELGADGRYRYALSYGAVDESSAGTWTRQGEGVLLTSDPSTPPALAYLGKTAVGDAPNALRLELDAPAGLPLQLFSAGVTLADGSTFAADFGADGLLLPLSAGEEVASVALALPMFEVRGQAVPVQSARGRTLRFAFRPNDLGFVAFDHAMLPLEKGALALDRYDRHILFRKVAEE